MAKATPIRNEITGSDLLDALQKDVTEVGQEMIETLLEQVEKTGGVVAQAVSVSIKYAPPADASDPGAFVVFAKVSASGTSLVHSTRVKRAASGGAQLSMFVE